jgi:alkylation response protein AidB-like acyl-CoA dehydrogenase
VDAEDFRQVRAAVRRLVRETVVPREEQIEDEDRIPDDLRAQAADMGLFGYALPEEYGGLGVTMSEDVALATTDGRRTTAVGRLVAGEQPELVLAEAEGLFVALRTEQAAVVSAPAGREVGVWTARS